MASLLDIVLQQRNPRMAGLLGGAPNSPLQQSTPAPAQPAIRSVQPLQRAPAPEAQPQGQEPSFLGRLRDSIFSIYGDDPETQRQAMLLAGLAMVGNRGHDGPGLGQAIIAGRGAAQQSAEKRAKKAAEEQMLARRAEIIGSTDLTDPAQRTAAMQAFFAASDFDGARMLNDIEAQFPNLEPVEAGDKIKLFDPRTGEWRGDLALPAPPRDTELRDAGTKILLIDKQTGDVISEFPKTLSPEAFRDRLDKTFGQTNALADDFRSETSALQDSLRLGQTATSAPADAAGDQTMVIAFNKLLDPTSVVREGEFDRVAAIGGFQARAQRFANEIAKDGRLSDQSRAALKAEVERMLQVNTQQLHQIAEQYIERANSVGVNPDFVVRRGIQPGASTGGRQDQLRNILLP